MFYYYLAAALLVAADQAAKLLTRQCIALGEHITLIPHVVGLTYVQNTGMAFSSLSSYTLLLTVVSLVASVLLAVAVWKDPFHSKFASWMLTLILAGAVGNLIDRAVFGFVTDMIEVLFVNFAVFNVADSFICVGVALLLIYALFFDRSEDKTDRAEKG
ncbi:MAG: signal peptidase II [Clostridiales bacterium]|nr:signal peptidase II [Clostridiales bacterium]